MAHFAQVVNGVVTQVIVAEQDFIDSGAVGPAAQWIQTSYNTQGGVHTLGGTPLRKNYAGIGYSYDTGRDAFIPPKPYPSWVLVDDTCLWESPVPMPSDAGTGTPPKMYTWNEPTTNWVEVVVPATE
jgi:hypothetical protein